MAGEYDHGLTGAIPEAVLGAHLNLPVQGKVSIRHLRVILISLLVNALNFLAWLALLFISLF